MFELICRWFWEHADDVPNEDFRKFMRLYHVIQLLKEKCPRDVRAERIKYE